MENTEKMNLANETTGDKICELRIKDMVSVSSITQALLLNGYSTKSHTKFKDFPREISIDYFVVEIYDHSTEKGSKHE